MTNHIRFLIATQMGGLPEMPYFKYVKFDEIIAENNRQALDLYNKKHNCAYFYGTILAVKVGGDIYLTEEALDVENIKEELKVLKNNRK